MWFAPAGLCAAALTLAGVYLYLDPQVPKAESYRHVKLETPLRVYSSDAALIAEFGERRLIPVTLEDVPEHFVNALLDTEDKRFYQHSGVDYISLVNDTLELLMAREIRSGASTITMQLARNISFSLEQTFIRKFKEMLLALKIEQELSKEEILQLYINVVPFGKRAYGAQAAALTYYGKPLKDLSLTQLAMLAGIPQAPSAGNPINGPERALRRRNLVLDRMRSQGSISQQAYDEAVTAPITARLHARDLDVAAPFAAEWVRSELIGRYADLYSGGYEVHTTIKAPLQEVATQALRSGLLTYDRRHGYRGAEARLSPDATDPTQLDKGNEATNQPPLEDIAAAGVADAQTLRAHWLQSLSNTRNYGGLQPAVVVGVEEDTARLLLKDGSQIALPMQAMAWARRYLDVDSVGPAPSTPDDVVDLGDLVRLRESDYGLELSQLPTIQGALVSLNPQTGAVLAMSGGFDFSMNQYNHAMQAARQPGSGFKPFVYSAALAAGVTPASIYMDAPLVFDDRNLEAQYRPDNDNNAYNGPTRLREALYRSINLVSIRVLLDITAPAILNHAQAFGFDASTFPRNTQLAIGGGTMAVTPLDMAAAYAVFANGGWRVKPNIIQRVVDINGEVVFEPRYPKVCDPCERSEPQTQVEPTDLAAIGEQTPVIPAVRVLDERNAYVMHTMLADVIRRGTGTRARALKRADLAGKTGTTNDAADTWFNGYGADVVTTVWVGFPNHQPLGEREYGSNTPLPIWIDYMAAALADSPERLSTQPTGVVSLKIDPVTGQLAKPGQRNAIFEYFLSEFTPQATRTGVAPDQEPDAVQIDPVDIF